VSETNIDFIELRKLNAEALTEAHDRYHSEIYRYVRYRVGEVMLSEDISSEVFVRLIESLHDGRGPKSSLRGWLFGTASNLIGDHFRNVYQHKVTDLPDGLESYDLDLQHQVEKNEALDTVRQSSRTLTQDQQHVLALRFGSELSILETAEIMAKKPNAVKALQFRALNTLRKTIGEDIA